MQYLICLFLCLLVAVAKTKASVAPASLDGAAAVQSKRLTLDTMHPGLKHMEYAVRGKVVIKADQIAQELLDKKMANQPNQRPYDHVVYTNIGNPHSVGQKPLTWPRQVLALVDLPPQVGVDHPDVARLFPADAIARARVIQDVLHNYGSGAYSHSQGARGLRQDVADFIQQRDGGVPCSVDDLFLTNGASAGIGMLLQTLVSGPNVGVMIPIPQYPLYSATIDLLEGEKVGYFLEEDAGWELNVRNLEQAYREAQARGVTVSALCLINPGNPSGSVLTRDNLRAVLQFCVDHQLVVLADEVYQENVYDDNFEFVSCKRMAYEMGLLAAPSNRDSDKSDKGRIELVSFHSTSKGVFGECGRRGGYMELVGIDPAVKDMIYKLASSTLCSTVSGQIMTSLMCRGPAPGDPSYASHEAERHAIWSSLKRKAQLVSQGLNAIPGFACQPATGSMYCFPSVQMPPGVLAEAAAQGTTPDTLYALDLLESTGICVVPASGFGQEEGRYGFRTTFLPSEEDLKIAVQKFAEHYQRFCEKYN